MSTNSTNEQPQWLKDLQQNSYFPELFLSGTLIAILFSLDVEISSAVERLKDYVSFPGLGMFIVILVPLIYSTLLGLKITLILHFISRMIWTAYIGLSYAFEDGIKKEKINYKGIYEKGLENKTPYHEQVKKLGKVSGGMFGLILFIITFMIGFFLQLFVFSIIIMFGVFIQDSLSIELDWFFGSFSLTYLVVISGYIIDFLILNKIRKAKFGYYLVLPGHLIFKYLGLSFIYRRLYYTYTSNFSQWKINLFIFIFIIGGYASAYPTISKIMRWPNIFETRENRFNIHNSKYRDRIDEQHTFLNSESIQSYIVENRLDIFIKYTKGMDNRMSEIGIDSIMNRTEKDNQTPYRSFERYYKIYNSIINKNLRVYIDNEHQKGLDWTMEYLPGSNVLGISTSIDISPLKYEKHLLYFGKKPDKEDLILREENIMADGYMVISSLSFKKVKQ